MSFRELLQGGDIGGMGKMEASALDLSVGAVSAFLLGGLHANCVPDSTKAGREKPGAGKETL